MRDHESFKGARGTKRDVDPARGGSMKFFKEAFENISIHNGSDSMSTLFLKEKQRVENAKSNVRSSF